MEELPATTATSGDRRRLRGLIGLLAGIAGVVAAHVHAASLEPTRAVAEINPAWLEAPLAFEPNLGQFDGGYRFLGRSGAGHFLIGDDVVRFVPRPARSDARKSPSPVTLRFLGAARMSVAEGRRPASGTSNYFGGAIESPITDVPRFDAIEYRDVYPGIDLVYYSRHAALEYDLVVKPGADPKSIRLAVDGVDEVALDGDGSLVLRANGGTLRQQAPDVYQTLGGRTVPVRGRYVVEPDGVIGVDLADYDHSLPLTIDPVLSYSTYLGGSGDDSARAVTTDPSGNVYVAGWTYSPNFPVLSAYGTRLVGTEAAFVSKFSPTGALLYSTYICASQSNWAQASTIAVDAAGNAYIAGVATDNFPVARNAWQSRRLSTQPAAFVAKLGPAGNQLLYATYVNYADPKRIAVDASGNAYLGGSGRLGFATTAGAFQTALPGAAGMYAPFVLKLNATGTAAVYSTFIGGTDFDGLNDMVLDGSGNAVIVGGALSADFPLAFPLQSTFAKPHANVHAFIAKLNATGTGLIYSTFLGGSADDEAVAVALDSAGAAYVAGWTSSPDFPLVAPYQPTASLPYEVQFVSKLSPAGNRLVYSTFFGGTCGGIDHPYCATYHGDQAKAIAVDAGGRAVVVGTAGSPYLPLVDSLEGPIPARGSGIFAARFSANGSSVLYSTVIGGGLTGSTGQSVAIDAAGNTWITGVTNRNDFPLAGASAQAAPGGVSDAVLLKFAVASVGVSLTSAANPVVAGTAVALNAQVSGAPAGGTVTFMDGNAFLGNATVTNGNATLLAGLPVGIRRLSAIYRDGSGEAESGALLQVVNPRNTCP